jgi:CDP-diacylglycerol--glycerol-3-phosphate 3-phosphatidyltransferase
MTLSFSLGKGYDAPMLMTNQNVRLYPHDRIMDVLFVRYLPAWLKPNQLTILRFALIPIVVVLIINEYWNVGVPLFIFAAFTDLLDGSIARIRKQITRWGTFADPAADKLLIGSVALVIVVQDLGWIIAALMIGIEVLIVTSGLLRQRKKWLVSANWAGKIKMLFQVIGVTLLLFASWFSLPFLIPIATVIIYIALAIAMISLFTYSL